MKNKDALLKITEALGVKNGETIIEIGPGHGELTEIIFEIAPKSKIIALEKDTELTSLLQKKFEKFDFEVVEGDALKILSQVSAKLKNYKLAGNIPYYITGFLLRTISEMGNKPKLAVLTVQKEVAERIVSEPPHMNRLAASVQFWAEPELLFGVKRGEFVPVPKVDSAVIALKTKENIAKNAEGYYGAVRIIFKQPRKTLINNLSEKMGKTKTQEILAELKIEPGLRPQDISVSQIESLALKIQ